MVFRLYVAGESPNSLQAVANLRSFCNQYLPDHHKIEIIDVFDEPLRMLKDGIVLTPTLVKVSPPPIQTLVGNLSDMSNMLVVLGISKNE